MAIRKYTSWQSVPQNDSEYWLNKTPQERLQAAKKLIERAERLYYSNPQNKPLYHEGRISKFHSITQ